MKKAKKVISIIFAILMIATLLSGCSTTTGGESASPSASPDVSVVPSESPTASSSDMTTDTIGYLSDKFDHFSRDPLKIAYICNYLSWAWNAALSENFDKLGKVLNYEYTVYSANADFDAYVNQIEVLASQGTQGFILGIDDALAPRTYEVCTELGVAFIAESTPYRDDTGENYWISVQQDQYNNGAQCVQWLADNYTNYWKDPIDTSKLGILVLNFSPVSGINEREPGCMDTFKKLFPEAAANYYVGDLVSLENGFSAQGGNTMTSTVIIAHPEVEYWFVVGLVDDWSQGATRAIESLQKEDKVLVASVQADAFLNEMASGYTGDVYVGACAVSSTEFAIDLAAGLVAILEGRATVETLWPEWQDRGSTFASMKVQGTMITKDTYKDFVDKHTIDAMVAAAK